MTSVPPDAGFDADDLALARRAARALIELPDAPPAWVAAAVALWPAAASAPAGLPAWLAGLRRVLATLRFDSAAQPALALGMRGARASTRQLLFSAEGYDLDLRLTPAPDGPGWQLDGQVLGPEGPMRVALSTGEAELGAAPPAGAPATSREVEPDEFGEFHFQGLAQGRWRLQLHLPALLVELPPIELDPQPARPGGAC